MAVRRWLIIPSVVTIVEAQSAARIALLLLLLLLIWRVLARDGILYGRDLAISALAVASKRHGRSAMACVKSRRGEERRGEEKS